MTSTLALALIGCRIIGQQLGIAALEYPVSPWVAWLAMGKSCAREMLEIDIDFGDIGCIHTYVCMYTHQTQDITSILEDIQKSQKTVLEHRKTLYYEPSSKIIHRHIL